MTSPLQRQRSDEAQERLDDLRRQQIEALRALVDRLKKRGARAMARSRDFAAMADRMEDR